jgi:hypothetical protein
VCDSLPTETQNQIAVIEIENAARKPRQNCPGTAKKA